jgi:hypothetical protein
MEASMPGTDHILIPTSALRTPIEGASPASFLRSDSPSCDVTAVFDGLDELLAACRSAPYDDRLTVMITACIERGINTRPRIVGAARRKSFNAEKASRFLTKATGKLWLREKDGVYSLIG